MKSMKRFLAGFLAFFYITSAFAGLDDEMRKTFNSMMNVSNPGYYEGQSRGVITGGNMFVRNKISQQSLFSFKAPSLSAGCGGIDFFGGSFSFINAEQFQQLLQGIASNALGYAFQLAMDVVCPTCSAVMKELQQRMQELSSMMTNSCEMGKWAVNLTGLDEAAQKSRDEAATYSANYVKNVDSFFDALPFSRKGAGGKPTNSYKDLTWSEKKEAGLIGNAVWKAVRNSNVANWYSAVGGAQTEMYKTMMSLTGTVIITDDTDADGEVAPTPKVRWPVIRMQEFMFGGEVPVYQCTDEAEDECTEMTVGTTNINGMLDKVRLMLDGDGGTTSIGIIKKLRDRGTASTFTAEEKKFVESTSPGILGLLRDFAHDIRSAKQVSDMFAIVLAQEMTINFINEMMDNVKNAQSNAKGVKNAREEVQKLFRNSQDMIAEARSSSAQTLQGVSNAFMAAAYVRSALKSRINAQRDPLTAD